ncbi:MAG: sugar phosphate isomerase/epimerase family protein [Desulfomonilaceae bacterium]
MKFAFSSNAFLRYGLLDTIRIVSSIGYRGIEIMADVPHAYPLSMSEKHLKEIRKQIDSSGMEISNVNAFMHHADGDTYHPSWIENEPDLRLKRVDFTLRCIEMAGKLGVANISTEPGGPLEDMSREEGVRLFIDGLRLVEKTARACKVRILIEPEPGLLIEKSDQFLEIIKQLDPEIFGINFDIGHFYCVGEDPSQLIIQMKPYIHHFHLEDIAPTREHHHLMLGHGDIDIHQVLDTVREINYDGYVTVELYTYEHEAEKAASEAYDFIQTYLSTRTT